MLYGVLERKIFFPAKVHEKWNSVDKHPGAGSFGGQCHSVSRRTAAKAERFLYRAAVLAVGFYNVLKMAFAKVRHPIEQLGKLFLIPFFMIHYGGFTAIHGFFALAIFSKGEQQGPPLGGESWPCFFVFLQMLFNIVKHIMLTIPPAVRLGVLSLFASHGVSFVYNYFIKGEYAHAKPQKLMGQPYARVVVMHITILAGGFLLMALGSPIALLLVLIVLKTAIDVKFHLREHKKAT